jgi:hypothetical protein
MTDRAPRPEASRLEVTQTGGVVGRLKTSSRSWRYGNFPKPWPGSGWHEKSVEEAVRLARRLLRGCDRPEVQVGGTIVVNRGCE